MTLHDLSCSNDPCLCERVYRVRSTVTRARARAYNRECTREVVDNVESPTAGLSRFPERSGRLRDHEGEASCG